MKTDNQIDTNTYIPEVFRSDIADTLRSTSFNPQLSSDNAVRVAGHIGADVSDRIEEPTTDRKVSQLATVMYNKVGTEETALSLDAFLARLSTAGVSTDDFASWGTTTHFNWAPPINIDKLVNYSQYFWQSKDSTPRAQYVTVEKRSSQAFARSSAASRVVQEYGDRIPYVHVDLRTGVLTVPGDYAGAVALNDVICTVHPASNGDISMYGSLGCGFWTIKSATFDGTSTTFTLNEPIWDYQGATPPMGVGVITGKLWHDTTTDTIKVYNGDWQPIVDDANVHIDIDLELISRVYATKAMAVSGYTTFLFNPAAMPWDTTTLDSVLWKPDFLESISFANYATWFRFNSTLSIFGGMIWYDTTTDSIRQHSIASGMMMPRLHHLSRLMKVCHRELFKPIAVGSNQWVAQNNWMHQNSLSSFTGVQRAQVPIIEYAATTEMSSWVKVSRQWKYRASPSQSFTLTDASPSVFELQPIVDYFAHQRDDGKWTLFLGGKKAAASRDQNVTSIFVPGFKFVVENLSGLSTVYTVETSVYREVNVNESSDIDAAIGSGTSCTVVNIVEEFASPLSGSAADVFIRPLATSMGDVFVGYHAHWLLTDTVSTTPAEPQVRNFYVDREQSDYYLVEKTIRGNAEFSGFQPQVASGKFGDTAEVIYVNTTNVRRVDLASPLRYSSVRPQYFSTATSDIRVYVNNVQQYGNYVELTETVTAPGVVVGLSSMENTRLTYVTAIVFDDPLLPYDVVRIETAPAALVDMGKHCVPVRTVEDETEFTLAVVDGTQPLLTSLTEYRYIPQLKTQLTQYPLFNVYKATSGEFAGTSTIFTYTESSTSAVNAHVQKRIVVGANGKDYGFTQHLATSAGLLSYRDLSKAHGYWYNPDTNVVKKWTGTCWSETFSYIIDGGFVVTKAIASVSEPQDPVQTAVWYNPDEQQLWSWQLVMPTGGYIHNEWVIDRGIVVSSHDPSLQLLWKGGSETISPTFVDASGSETHLDDAAGCWAQPTQWTHNATHETRADAMLSGVLEHCTSVAGTQVGVPLTSSPISLLMQDEVDFSKGGTIKEYGSSLNTLISSMMVSNTTPIGVIEFANREYDNQTQRIINTTLVNITDLMTSVRVQHVVDFQQHLISVVEALYTTNDLSSANYVDSTAFDATSGVGMKGWIATAPMLGLSVPRVPLVHHVKGITELLCHDGHRYQVIISNSTRDKLSRNICATEDARRPGSTFGVMSTGSHPTTYVGVVSTYGNILPVLYHYQTGSASTLRVFAPYAVAPIAPPTTGVPAGTRYYNTSLHSVFELQNGDWAVIATGGDVSTLWSVVSFPDMCAAVLLDVERKLYDAAISINVARYAFTNHGDTYLKLAHDRFSQYVNEQRIAAPLVNNEYVASDPFTWNYAFSTISTVPSIKVHGPATGVATWQGLYSAWFGTPYPHLEPWILQGYAAKPTWWDEEYSDDSGTRMWKSHMWTNVLEGRVPLNRHYPNGVESTGGISNDDGVVMLTYAYLPVNTTSVVLGGVYALDALLPPYMDISLISNAFPTVRSLFDDYAAIVQPFADYVFGTSGPTEWAWKTSSKYIYDQAIIAFRQNPVLFLQQTFGDVPVVVNGLPLDPVQGTPLTHSNVRFHGTTDASGNVVHVNGLNQWYVMFNRSLGADVGTIFASEWAGWSPRLAYRTGGVVDVNTLAVSSDIATIVAEDYSVALVESGTVRSVEIDAFRVNVIKNPPALIQYNPQADWVLSLSPISKYATTVKYYAPKIATVTVSKNTNELFAYSAAITSTDVVTQRVTIHGNGVEFIAAGDRIDVRGQEVTVKAISFNPYSNTTRVDIVEPLAGTGSDFVTNISRTLPWVTGDSVVITSTKYVPAPFTMDTPYFVIRTGDRSFKLAETYALSMEGTPIDITTSGIGLISVAEVKSSFFVMGGQGSTRDVWYHYALNYGDLREVPLPYAFTGMQTLINIIDGVDAYQETLGVKLGGVNGKEFDPFTGRSVSWAHETERFIDWAYQLRNVHARQNDTYAVRINVADDTMTFVGDVPEWPNGSTVKVMSSELLPVPLTSDVKYYIEFVNTDATTFQLTVNNAYGTTTAVNLTTPGSGTVEVQLFTDDKTYPSFELNPGRNHVWVDTTTGVLADVFRLPVGMQYGVPTIYDQYQRPLTPDDVVVYRNSSETHITVRRDIPNDVDPFATSYDEHIHIGGMRSHIIGYEHYVLFSNYTLDGSLIYDSFLGLRIPKAYIELIKGREYNLRPELGGYYLRDGTFTRNIEGSISDLRACYDAYSTNHTSPIVRQARALTGFTGQTASFMPNKSATSQFQFYRGMIGAKGTLGAVTAFTNNADIASVSIDEYWAWKIAEYGDARRKWYPEVVIKTPTSVADDIKFRFIAKTEDANVLAQTGYSLVAYQDSTAWVEAPKQHGAVTSPMFFDGQAVTKQRVYIGKLPPQNAVDVWINNDSIVGTVVSVNHDLRTVTVKTNRPRSVLLNSTVIDIDRVGRFAVVDITERSATELVATLKSTWDPTINAYGKTATIHNFSAYQKESGVWTKTALVTCTSTAAYHQHNALCDATRFVKLTPSRTQFIMRSSIDNPSTPYDENVSAYTIINAYTIHVMGDVGAYIGDTITFSDGSPNAGTYWIDDRVGVVPRTGVSYDAPANITKIVLRTQLTSTQVGGSITTTYDSFEAYDAAESTQASQLNARTAKYSYGESCMFEAYYILPDYSKLNPARIIDTKTRAVQARISMWDPARHQHSAAAIGDIDVISSVDPVSYITDFDAAVGVNWATVDRVGQIWLDTSSLDYMPYYDSAVVPLAQERLRMWGALAPRASADVYEFVESSIPPANRAAAVATQAADSSSYQQQKLTGTPRRTLYRRSRQRFEATPDSASHRVEAPNHNFVNGSAVLFTTDGDLPTALEQGTAYFVTSANDTSFAIKDSNGVVVAISNDGTGQMFVARAFTSGDWVEQVHIRDHVCAPAVAAAIGATLPTTVAVGTEVAWNTESAWNTDSDSDMIDVYVNGVLVLTSASVHRRTDGHMYVTTDVEFSLYETDVISFVRLSKTSIDDNTIDDGVALVQWTEVYPYNSRTVNTGDARSGSQETTLYYYWVTSTTNTQLITNRLCDTKQMCFIVQAPIDNPIAIERYGFGTSAYGDRWSSGSVTSSLIQPVVVYRDAIIRRVSDVVSNGGSYSVQFTSDGTLRSRLHDNTSTEKPVHEEWKLIRRNQMDPVPVELWNKLTESVIGRSLSDATVRVPSLAYELHDAAFGTSIRYGIMANQTFVDAAEARATIKAYLTDPTHDFGVVNIPVLLSENDINTEEGALNILNTVWTQMDAHHINNMWFDVLDDALVRQPRLEGLIKTSWISVTCTGTVKNGME